MWSISLRTQEKEDELCVDTLEKTCLRKHLSLLHLSEWAGLPWWRRHRTRERQNGQDALGHRDAENMGWKMTPWAWHPWLLKAISLSLGEKKPLSTESSDFVLCNTAVELLRDVEWETDQWAQGNDIWVTLSPVDNPFTWLGRPADALLPFYLIAGSPRNSTQLWSDRERTLLTTDSF